MGKRASWSSETIENMTAATLLPSPRAPERRAAEPNLRRAEPGLILGALAAKADARVGRESKGGLVAGALRRCP